VCCFIAVLQGFQGVQGEVIPRGSTCPRSLYPGAGDVACPQHMNMSGTAPCTSATMQRLCPNNPDDPEKESVQDFVHWKLSA